MFDTQKFIDGVHEYIGKAIAPLRAKMDEISTTVSEQMVGVSNELTELRGKAEALEARSAEKGDKGDKGDAADPAPTLEEVLPPLLEATRGLVDPIVAELKTSGAAILEGTEKKIEEAVAGMQEAETKKGEELISRVLQALKQKFEQAEG